MSSSVRLAPCCSPSSSSSAYELYSSYCSIASTSGSGTCSSSNTVRTSSGKREVRGARALRSDRAAVIWRRTLHRSTESSSDRFSSFVRAQTARSRTRYTSAPSWRARSMSEQGGMIAVRRREARHTDAPNGRGTYGYVSTSGTNVFQV
jgi:hypothetical protein